MGIKNSLILLATTYKRDEKQRQQVIDRVNLAKSGKSISRLALERWFTKKYLKKYSSRKIWRT